MKKAFLCGLVMVAGSVSVFASDYPVMKFGLADGSDVSVQSDGLSMTFDNDRLLVSHSVGLSEIDLSKLTKFYFSGNSSSIESVQDTPGEVEVFSTTGIYLGSYPSDSEARSALADGFYIFRTNTKTYKTNIK